VDKGQWWRGENSSMIYWIYCKCHYVPPTRHKNKIFLKRCWILLQAFSVIYWDDLVFVLHSVYVLYCIYWSPSLEWNLLDHGVWSF
jgi:hypothetical protein